MKFLTLLIFPQVFILVICLQGSAEKIRPNILWLVVEDQSKHYGFNGEKLVHTPVVSEQFMVLRGLVQNFFFPMLTHSMRPVPL